MNKIWEILNIEPTNDKAAIKRAYALLARKYNPEEEPGKFQELHEAYKQALFLADNAGIVNEEAEDINQTGPSEDKEKDAFDFSTVDQDYLPDNNIAEEIIEDIISFRESNNLSSRGELKMLSHPMKEALSMQMLAMYRFLAYTTDDITVWDSFFNEPLIRYCLDYKEFRDTVLQELGENPAHLEAAKKLMSEHEEVPSSSFITVKEKGFTYSLEKRKKGLIIMILAWLAQLIFSLFLIMLLIDVPLVPTILGALMVVGFLAITVYTIAMFSNQ